MAVREKVISNKKVWMGKKSALISKTRERAGSLPSIRVFLVKKRSRSRKRQRLWIRLREAKKLRDHQ